MRLKAAVGSVKRVLEAEVRAGKRAATIAIKAETEALKNELRDQVRRAFGAGARALPTSWRGEAYPRTGASLRAAGIVWSKVPNIVTAFDDGAAIRPRGGRFLAVALPAAGQRAFRKKVTPELFEQRTGLKLRPVFRRGKPGLLVTDGGRINTRGIVASMTRAGRVSGARKKVTIPVFALIPLAKMPKRLDVSKASRNAANRIPRAVVAAWERESGRRA